jgi:hypothetical protein
MLSHKSLHALNELTANVLFAVAESPSSFGKAQRRESGSHFEHHFYYVFLMWYFKKTKSKA